MAAVRPNHKHRSLCLRSIGRHRIADGQEEPSGERPLGACQAHKGRQFILGKMAESINGPRENLSPHAPAIESIKIDPEKIGAVIGKGGETIRGMCEEFEAEIDVEDDGSVFVSGIDPVGCDQAKAEVEALTLEAEVGKIYAGKVVNIVDFGAFVTILPGKDGLVHISQIANQRIENVTDVLSEGQQVRVKVLDVDPRGRIKLSIKEVAEDDAAAAAAEAN